MTTEEMSMKKKKTEERKLKVKLTKGEALDLAFEKIAARREAEAKKLRRKMDTADKRLHKAHEAAVQWIFKSPKVLRSPGVVNSSIRSNQRNTAYIHGMGDYVQVHVSGEVPISALPKRIRERLEKARDVRRALPREQDLSVPYFRTTAAQRKWTLHQLLDSKEGQEALARLQGLELELSL
jgi:hypothetical protein